MAPDDSAVTMLATTPRTALDETELADLRRRMCETKRCYGRHSAMTVAARMRSQGEARISAYPCPFHEGADAESGSRTWHVGHPPSVYRTELLARYLRFGGP